MSDSGWFPSLRTLRRNIRRLFFGMAWFYFGIGLLAARGFRDLPPDRDVAVTCVAFAAFLMGLAAYLRGNPNA